VVVVVVVVISVMYFKDRSICCSRRKGRGRTASIFSNAALKEDDAVTKEAESLNRASFASERESIMFSRSRSSSMQFVQNADTSYQPHHQFNSSISHEGGHSASIPLIIHHPPRSPTTSESAEIVSLPSRTASTSPDQQQRRTSLSAPRRHYSTNNVPAVEIDGNNENSPMLSRSHSASNVSPI